MLRAGSVALAAAFALSGCHDYDRLTLCLDDPDRPECQAAEACEGASRCTGEEPTCDGFETGPLDAAWTSTSVNGTVDVEPDMVCRGDGALHVTTVATPLEGAIEAHVARTIENAPRHYFVRWFMWLSERPENRTVLASLAPALALDAGFQIGIENGFLGLFDPVQEAWNQPGVTPVPTERWACIELEVKESAADGTVTVRLDDTELDELTLAGDTEGADGIEQAYLGLQAGNPVEAQPALDLWIDEVAVSDASIGCHE